MATRRKYDWDTLMNGEVHEILFPYDMDDDPREELNKVYSAVRMKALRSEGVDVHTKVRHETRRGSGESSAGPPTPDTIVLYLQFVDEDGGVPSPFFGERPVRAVYSSEGSRCRECGQSLPEGVAVVTRD